MSEKWSMIFGFNLVYKNYHYPRFINFDAENDQDAKKKVLDFCKKIVARMKHAKWEYFIIQAMPYCKQKSEILDGNRMIRIKLKFSNRKILRIKNPDKVLVQGYGTEALKQLSRS
ncbi:MAG: hypothetical protein HYV51_03835 [Parcubacteria group bacterium]|nr:hypothetical protein [Parcubacteria group bacterium]